MIREFISDRFLSKNRYRGYLLLFLALYLITILVQWRNNLLQNLATLFYLVMNLVVFFAYDLRKEAGAVKKEIRFLTNCFITVAFFGQLVSLLIFILNIRLQFTYADGGATYITYIGMHGGRLWGFFTNPNNGAAFALFSIMAMPVSYFCYEKEERRKPSFMARQVFFAVNLVLQASVFYLCNSRVTWICVSLYLCGAPLCYSFFCSEDRGAFRRSIRKCLAVSVLLPLAFYGADDLVKSVMPNLVLSTNYFSEQLEEGLKEGISGGIAEIEDDTEGEDIPSLDREDYGTALGGRKYLWKAGGKVVRNHPLLGVGAGNVAHYATLYSIDPENPDKSPYLPGINAGLHNEYLQVLASSGIAGFILLAIVAVRCGLSSLRYFIKTREKGRTNPLVLAMMGFNGVLLFRAFGETGLIYNLSAPSILFWSYLGYSLYFMEKECPGGDRLCLRELREKLTGFRERKKGEKGPSRRG